MWKYEESWISREETTKSKWSRWKWVYEFRKEIERVGFKGWINKNPNIKIKCSTALVYQCSKIITTTKLQK